MKLATFPPEEWEHSPLHNGLGLTPAAAVCLARRHARPINALGDDQPTLSALYYDLFTSYADMKHVAMHAGLDQKEQWADQSSLWSVGRT